MGRPETPGVWPSLLITRRSQVQILPPLPSVSNRRPGPPIVVPDQELRQPHRVLVREIPNVTATKQEINSPGLRN